MTPKILTNDQYIELVKQWKKYEKKKDIVNRNKVAEQILAGLHLFIWKLVRRNMRRCEAAKLDDAYAEAALSVVTHGLKNFDPDKAKELNCKFISYISWWIKNAVIRSIGASQLVHVPENVRVSSFSKRRKGQELNDREQAGQISYVYWDAPADGSSHNGYHSDSHMTKRDIMTAKAEDYTNRLDEVILNARKKKAMSLLEALSGRHKHIMEQCLDGVTLQEIGNDLGLSRERVRQLREEAIRLMKKNYEREVKRDKSREVLDP